MPNSKGGKKFKKGKKNNFYDSKLIKILKKIKNMLKLLEQWEMVDLN